MSKILLSHPTGNANVRSAVQGISDAGLLSEFYTSLAFFPGDNISHLIKLGGPFAEFQRRMFDSSLKKKTKSIPFRELGRLILSKTGPASLIKHETGFFCIDKVYQNIDLSIAAKIKSTKKASIHGIYAYEDGAEYSFRAGKEMGITCFYDLPIGYWRAARFYLESELKNRPEWASTIKGFRDSQKKLERKDEELRLADHIFVASTFTKSTLKYFPGTLAPVDVIPYGFPPVGEKRQYSSVIKRPLRLLFVGGLSQRKGIANLFEAADLLGEKIELTIVGRKSTEDCPALNQSLAKHKWIPSLNHSEVLKLMREQDVLIFPSLFEGFGLVISEAMSQGTPVITTDRTAGPDLISDGENGWLVEAGSTESLIQAIEKLLYNPDQIRLAGKAAMETARKRPWKVYGQELTNAIENIMSSNIKR